MAGTGDDGEREPLEGFSVAIRKGAGDDACACIVAVADGLRRVD
jgi:hypothetical protein